MFPVVLEAPVCPMLPDVLLVLDCPLVLPVLFALAFEVDWAPFIPAVSPLVPYWPAAGAAVWLLCDCVVLPELL